MKRNAVHEMRKMMDLLKENTEINEVKFAKAKLGGKDWLGNDMVYVGREMAVPIGAVDHKDEMERFVLDYTRKNRSPIMYKYGYLEYKGKYVIVKY